MARVTVVNDNPEFLELMGEVLEAERYEAIRIDAGGDTVKRVRESKPDLLIIDLRLSNEGLRGWDVVQEIRRSESLEDLPVLLTSADLQALTEVEAQLRDQRAVEVLPKPFGIDELTDTVQGLLGGAPDR